MIRQVQQIRVSRAGLGRLFKTFSDYISQNFGFCSVGKEDLHMTIKDSRFTYDKPLARPPAIFYFTPAKVEGVCQ